MAAKQKEEHYKAELLQNNTRLFALAENLESMYDVDMESGHYDVFVKGEFYRNNVLNKLSVPHDYFEELRDNIDAVIYEEDRAGLYNTLTRESIRRELENHEHFDYLYRINSGNGPVWLKIRIVYKDEDRKNIIIGVFNAEKDVETRQLQKAYDEANNANRSNRLVLSFVNGIKWTCRIDERDRIIDAQYDDSASGEYGNDFRNDPLAWTERVHPEDREGLLAEVRKCLRDHTGTERIDYAFRLRSTDGKFRWFKVTGRVIRKEDGTRELTGITIDVTEQMEKEREQQRQLEEQNNQLKKNMELIGGLASGYNALYYINIDENLLHIYALDEAKYPGSRAIFEGAETDFYKIIGDYGLSEQVHPDDRHLFENFGPEWIREKLTGRKKYSMRFRAAAGSGYRWDEMELTKCEDQDTTANAVAVGFTDRDSDIRKEQEYQQRLEDARKAADAANISKSNFLFNMSHDIRTPMNAIRGFTTMAKKNAGNVKRVAEYLDKIDISGQQLLTLINQVLEMARIESGKIQFEEKPINIREEFNSMVTVLDEQARSNGLSFSYSLDDIEHNRILADEARMSSVTLNIVGNAMKYTPSGGKIEFRLREVPARKPGYGTYTFTVSDTGIGMSKEFIQNLYEPFSREKNNRA